MAITSRTIKFTGGTTTNITGAFNIYGSLNSLMSITSDTITPATLSANIGIINCQYIQPSYITCTGGSVWLAPLLSCVDGGNNLGWIFMKNLQARVSGTWKNVTLAQIRINGVWKYINKAQIKISGVWKSVF